MDNEGGAPSVDAQGAPAAAGPTKTSRTKEALEAKRQAKQGALPVEPKHDATTGEVAPDNEPGAPGVDIGQDVKKLPDFLKAKNLDELQFIGKYLTSADHGLSAKAKAEHMAAYLARKDALLEQAEQREPGAD
jgi:hypothetical protein